MTDEALALIKEFRARPVDRKADGMTDLAGRLAAHVVELEAEVERLRKELRDYRELERRRSGRVPDDSSEI